MVTLSTEQLKDFQRRTQYIQRNTILPALSYIKMEMRNGKHYLTKNNLRCACVALVKSATKLDGHDPILLDDRIFMGFINITKSPDVTVSWDDKNVKISDGKTNIKFSKEDYTNFPSAPPFSAAQTQFVFTKQHLDAVAIAKSFILDAETGGNFRFIHVGGEFISAFHTNFFYINNQFSGLPEVRIDSEMADVITSVDSLQFSTNGNHYFFLAVDMIYIFTMQEGQSPNIKSVFERAKTAGKDFKIFKDDVMQFLTAANMVTESAMADCRIKPHDGGGALDFQLLDDSYNRGVDRIIKCEGTMDDFNFDSKLLVNPMKAVPYDEWKAKTVQNNFIIEGTHEYFTFMGLAPKVSK